jgi:hypothetical protein
MNTTSMSLRARIALVIAAAGTAVALLALPLALRARADHHAAVRLLNDDLVLAQSVAETRGLVTSMRLDVAQAALHPNDRAPAARVDAARDRVVDELRRIRLHAADKITTDVADDLENSLLRFDGAAERVFEAAKAGNRVEAEEAETATGPEAARLHELADELTTIAETGAQNRAASIGNGQRVWGLLGLALAGIVLAIEAGFVAVSDDMVARAIIEMLPPRPRAALEPHLPAEELPAGDVDGWATEEPPTEPEELSVEPEEHPIEAVHQDAMVDISSAAEPPAAPAEAA